MTESEFRKWKKYFNKLVLFHYVRKGHWPKNANSPVLESFREEMSLRKDYKKLHSSLSKITQQNPKIYELHKSSFDTLVNELAEEIGKTASTSKSPRKRGRPSYNPKLCFAVVHILTRCRGESEWGQVRDYLGPTGELADFISEKFRDSPPLPFSFNNTDWLSNVKRTLYLNVLSGGRSSQAKASPNTKVEREKLEKWLRENPIPDDLTKHDLDILDWLYRPNKPNN